MIPPFFACNPAGCRLALFGHLVEDPDNHRQTSNLAQMRKKLRFVLAILYDLDPSWAWQGVTQVVVFL